ncbi:hypothetical protein J6590_020590 [Homalodisca vitripennis]|nr:hypothetical protein J6590_020590 [Homalodisca vitripennis]
MKSQHTEVVHNEERVGRPLTYCDEGAVRVWYTRDHHWAHTDTTCRATTQPDPPPIQPNLPPAPPQTV